MASARQLPHISRLGCSEPQNVGRSGELNILQLISSAKFTQGTPAGLPFGIPGIKLFMEGAVQQAPQFFRQVNFSILFTQLCQLCKGFCQISKTPCCKAVKRGGLAVDDCQFAAAADGVLREHCRRIDRGDTLLPRI